MFHFLTISKQHTYVNTTSKGDTTDGITESVHGDQYIYHYAIMFC